MAPLTAIPGFGDIPGLDVKTGKKERGGNKNKDEDDNSNTGRNFDFWFTRKSIAGRSRRSSSEDSRGETKDNGAYRSQTVKDRRVSEPRKDSAPSTPTDKIRYDDDFNDEMTPLPNISYQSALLESMEQSALQVRTEDYDMYEDTPTKSWGTDNERKRTNSAVLEDSPIAKQQKTDESGTEGSGVDVSDDEDDDDEEGGLVIDLSPVENPSDNVSERFVSCLNFPPLHSHFLRNLQMYFLILLAKNCNTKLFIS